MKLPKEHVNRDMVTITNISTMNNIEKVQNYLTSNGLLSNLILVWKLNLAFWKNTHIPEEKELAICV